ncbi:MAG: hypothetical protein LBP79_02640 [Clostridiales bacterium]|jgi:hypothetical protein|nr:hypothetical protein [Clostridiales bacterium]
MAKRTEHYFIPAKDDYYDYNCNIFSDAITQIQDEWQKENKPLIDRAIKEIKDAEYEWDNMCGVLENDEAMMNSSFLQRRAQGEVEAKRKRLYLSLYAQFFHQMVSKIEAVTVAVITRNDGYDGDRFDRNVLYAFGARAATTEQERIKELKGFSEYDKLYTIWHFIKHNSKSTYEAVLNLCPEILQKDPWNEKELRKYKQGDLAIFYIHFTNELIEQLLDGVKTFFKEFCRLVFGEDYDEAQWNYTKYFMKQVNSEIDGIRNPLGLPWWI